MPKATERLSQPQRDQLTEYLTADDGAHLKAVCEACFSAPQTVLTAAIGNPVTPRTVALIERGLAAYEPPAE